MPEFQFQSISEFLAMGGHATYVWSSYAIFAAMIAFNLIQPVLVKRRIIIAQRARIQRQQHHQENITQSVEE